ncbi:molybdopterin-dependent oxidoreductase [Dokdonella sp.]|uniref:molybdopterin-dependent oxidoreductase n=1 Tax=Dokdonella sp. TaxID=2291710 RepID=UPI003C43A481
MRTSAALPPGQREIESFPRFGLTPFAVRFPKAIDAIKVQIAGDVESSLEVGTELDALARVEQCSDFHCVTTWTHRALRWSGIRFSDFYRQVVVPLARPSAQATFVVLRGQDGARSSLPLEDLLASDVILADRLNGEPLTIKHGAPLRLVAPAHYGYKSVKHVNRIEFWTTSSEYRPVGFRFMDHPRARVAYEERGQWIPGWVLRYLYRPLVRPTMSRFERTLKDHLKSIGRGEEP